MTESEVRGKYPPRKVGSQVEFDDYMNRLNNEQTIFNHPYLDRERELTKQRKLIETQKQALNIQLNAIKVERIELEQKQKDINRVFHQLKHEMIELNPKGLKNTEQ